MTKPYWQSDGLTVYQGNALDVLKEMPPESVHCIVTSMPYFGLRSYPVEPVDWPSGHYTPMAGLAEVEVNAWRGSLGLEPTPTMYIAHLVLIWRQLWRVLRSDGTCWIVIADSYASSPRGNKPGDTSTSSLTNPNRQDKVERGKKKVSGLLAKNLIGIPWRLAFALQAEGWTLRSSLVWAKGISFCKTYSGSCMPESVHDRPTRSYENVFLLSKSKRYFYDGYTVKERAATGWNNSSFTDERDATTKPGLGMGKRRESASRNLRSVWAINPPQTPYQMFLEWLAEKVAQGDSEQYVALAKEFLDEQKNLKSTWTINPEPSSLPHYAAFPQRLIEPMIKAGSSERGCCPKCGVGWRRVTERTSHVNTREPAHVPGNSSTKVDSTGWALTSRTTGGWHPGCTCYDELTNVYEMPNGKWAAAAQCVTSEPFDTQELAKRWALEQMTTVPATILDPFLGSGVTLKVAAKLRRNGIGIELSEEYAAMAVEQLRKPLQVELF